jgi:hypothetical protein
MKWFPLLCCAMMLIMSAFTPLYATVKTERVESYLGSYRYEFDKPVGTVKFIFQRAILTREGNGKKSYKLLLIGQRGFTNLDNAGELLAIQVVYKGVSSTIYPEPVGKNKSKVKGKEAIAPIAEEAEPVVKRSKRGRASRSVPAQLVNEAPEAQLADEPVATRSVQPDPVRPRPLFPDQAHPGQSGGISLPDSATIARNLEGAKSTVTTWRTRMWQSAQPIWEFVMWVFNSVIVLLICFGGLCRYVAKTAAAESRVNRKGRVVVGRWVVGAHQNASAMLLIISWVIAIFFLIDIFMWLVYLDLPIWLLVVIWFPVLWFAEKLTSWIVPNLRGDEVAMQ